MPTGCVMFNSGKEIRTVLFTAWKSVQAHAFCHIHRQSAGLMVAQLAVPCVQNESKSAGFWLEQWPTRHENCLLCFSNNASFRELYECEGIWQLGVHGMYRRPFHCGKTWLQSGIYFLWIFLHSCIVSFMHWFFVLNGQNSFSHWFWPPSTRN